MLFQLLPRNLRVAAGQTVFGQGADAGERRAQVVRDIAGKFALRLHAALDPRQQAIDGVAQPLDVVRQRRQRDRTEERLNPAG